MAYIPKEWKDLPDETTPIQASDLNHIEQGVGDLSTNVDTLNTNVGDLSTLNTTEKSNLVGAINEVLNKARWKLLQSGVQAGTNLSIAEIEFEELYIEISIGEASVSINSNIVTFFIPKGTLSSETKNFRNGFFYNDDVNGSVALEATMENIRFTDVYFKKTPRNSYARMNVWYK